MSTINRKDFVSDLSQGYINVNDLSSATQDQLNKLGIKPSDLKKIAGKDGQISGEAELNKLFSLVDTLDRDGSANTFSALGQGETGVETASGAVYEALKAEVQRNLTKAHTQGVIHLGMRKESTVEADALEKAVTKSQGGVVRIEGFKSEGVIEYDGKSINLNTSAGLEEFRKALISGPDKMSSAQAKKFVDYIAGRQVDTKSRDELAQLGLTLFRNGKGEHQLNRLVLSGHGLPGGVVFGDGMAMFEMEDIKELAQVFPEGAKKIEHVAVAACYCAGTRTFEVLREAFPNLKSGFAYSASAPKAEKGAPVHLLKWESMTDGDDPSQVDPPFYKTVTWNPVDGTQGLPNISLRQAEADLKEFEFAYEDYKTGRKKPEEGRNDRLLNEYYARLSDLINHRQVSSQRRAELNVIRREVLKLRTGYDI